MPRRSSNSTTSPPSSPRASCPTARRSATRAPRPRRSCSSKAQNSTKFAKGATEWVTLIPTVYNADTLGIRPDLIKRPITSWKELLNPEFKGKASILNIPSIGIMDAAMVVEASALQVSRQGQHDEGRDRPHDEGPDRGQEGRPVPRLLEGLQRVRQPDGLGRDGDPVDVVPGRHGSAFQGHSLRVPAAQGRLPLLGVGLLHVEGRHRQEADSPTSSSTGSCPAGPAPISTARATTPPFSPPPRPT